MMKRIASCLIVLLAGSVMLPLLAQDNADKEKKRHERWERFRQEKHKFYIETLELTDQQSAPFFALYDEMEQKKFEANREVRHENRRIIKKGDQATDAEYQAAANQAASLHEKEAAIEKEYYARICQILTPKQQFLYHCCELDFQKRMIKMKSAQKKEQVKK